VRPVVFCDEGGTAHTVPITLVGEEQPDFKVCSRCGQRFKRIGKLPTSYIPVEKEDDDGKHSPDAD
jgi:hypothetical protein